MKDDARQTIERLRSELAQARAELAAARSESALERASSEATFRAIFANAAVGIVLRDLTGRILETNPAVGAMLGYTDDELKHLTVRDLSMPEDYELDAARFSELVAGRRDSFRLVKRYLRKDRSVLWGQVVVSLVRGRAGEPLFAIGMVEDISDQKRAEAELARTVAELQNLMETIPDLFYTLDTEGNLVKWNRRLEEVTGYTGDEIARMNALDFFRPEDRPAVEASIDAKLTRGFGQHVSPLLTKDGLLIPYQWIGARLVDTEGRLVGVIGLGRDITEHQHLEEALRQQNEQLREVDRLKSAFVNSVSHELRTPLTSILGYAEFLEDRLGGPLTSEQEVYVAQIQQGARRLRRLVDDLLDFARLEAGTFKLLLQDADLAAKAREVIESFRPQAAERRLALSAELPAEPVMVRMDPGRIQQVLINLVGNAIKFTPPGGSIVVSVQPRGSTVHTAVTDTGVGIAPNDQLRLFQKFYQVDRSTTRETGGAGLGLSISKALVEAHGGRVGVVSALGEGATFWFDLPLASRLNVTFLAQSEAEPGEKTL